MCYCFLTVIFSYLLCIIFYCFFCLFYFFFFFFFFLIFFFFFFFQAEDGIRDADVTGDQTCALPIFYIELGNEDDAYIIFETLNTRGKDLRVSDLVKNHLTKMLPKRNKSVDLSKDKWTDARTIIEGSNIDLNMDSFLHHFWLSKYEFTTQKKLFKSLKQIVNKRNAKDFLNDVLNE